MGNAALDASHGRKLRILVVDDDKDIVQAVKSGLERHGIDVNAFSDSVAAYKHFMSSPIHYDLVLLDIKMPNLNGFDFARGVRNKNSDIKIAFITAFEVSKREFDALMPSLKIDAFIQKPISPTNLAWLLRQIFAIDYLAGADNQHQRQYQHQYSKPGAESSLALQPTLPKHSDKKTVMLCDSDPDLLKLYAKTLQVKYNIISAFSGKECIDKYTKLRSTGQSVDVLVLEYRLGDMLGTDVVNKIRDMNGTQVVLVSISEIEDLQRSDIISRILKKPVSMKLLAREIEHAIAAQAT
jgi:response regulator RpfG family c-di-GMP phosphodiesterase